MQQYLKWAGIKHQPTLSADDPEANGLAERFMQAIGHSWATAHVEDKDPVGSLNAKLKMYRNTEHSVTKRKPSEWLFGRCVRTRLPNKKLQTQCLSVEDIEAKRRIVERGKDEKERHDKSAREEKLEVGMQVLLRMKKRRKGMPRFDPMPYTIIELVGRQAVLQRGEQKLRRETQKFKRFQPSVSNTAPHMNNGALGGNYDEWEMALLPEQVMPLQERETYRPHEQSTPQEGRETALLQEQVMPPQEEEGRETALLQEQVMPPQEGIAGVATTDGVDTARDNTSVPTQVPRSLRNLATYNKPGRDEAPKQPDGRRSGK